MERKDAPPTRGELLTLALFKELKRIGILSESEMQNVVSNYVSLRILSPPKASIEEVADENFSVMLTMMASSELADTIMNKPKRREGG